MRVRNIALLGAALVLAACGGSTQHQSPQQILLAAARNASGTSLRVDMSLSEAFNISGPAAGDFTQLSAQPLTMSGHFAAANATRVTGSLTIAFAGHTESVDVIVANGTAYVSSNGGVTYSTESSSQIPASDNGVNSALQYLNSVGSVTDEGPGSADGVSGEKYHATFDAHKLTQVLQSIFASINSQLATELANAFTLKGGAIDVLIDGSGHLVTESGYFDVSVDLGSVSPQLSGNTMSVHASLNAHLYDYGASITVTPPATAA
jgi:hypothetical protein